MQNIPGRRKLSELESVRRACKRARIKLDDAINAYTNQTPEHKLLEQTRAKGRGRPPLTLAKIVEKEQVNWENSVNKMREVEEKEGSESIPIEDIKDVEDPSLSGKNPRVGAPRGTALEAIDYKIRRFMARKLRVEAGEEDGMDYEDRERGSQGGARGRMTMSRQEKLAILSRDIKHLMSEVSRIESLMTPNEMEQRKLKLMRSEANVLRALLKKEGLVERLKWARLHEGDVVSGEQEVEPMVKKTLMLELKIKTQKDFVSRLLKEGKLNALMFDVEKMHIYARRGILQAGAQLITEKERKLDRDKRRGVSLRRELANGEAIKKLEESLKE